MLRNVLAALLFSLTTSATAFAGAGHEAASFLDIPLGAEAAALGNAYSAVATNAYAPTYNPAGLGYVPTSQIAAQHLSYLESIHYEYLSFVHAIRPGRAWGASMQYLGSGDIAQTDDSGQQTGTFSSHFAAYTLAYGQQLNDKISLGIAGKWINAKISDVNANAFAGDAGVMVQASEKLTLAGVMSNAGTQLTFLNDGGSLPLTGRLGAAYAWSPQLLLAAEGDYQATGLSSGHFGVQVHPLPFFSLRAGYRTDTTKALSPIAGLTAGFGLDLWGQEFSYAWLPYGDLGTTQYFSLLLRFGKAPESRRNLIQYQTIKKHRMAMDSQVERSDPEYQQLMQLLSDDVPHYVSHGTAEAP